MDTNVELNFFAPAGEGTSAPRVKFDVMLAEAKAVAQFTSEKSSTVPTSVAFVLVMLTRLEESAPTSQGLVQLPSISVGEAPQPVATIAKMTSGIKLNRCIKICFLRLDTGRMTHSELIRFA